MPVFRKLAEGMVRSESLDDRIDLVVSTLYEETPCGNWFVTGRIRSIRIDFELRLRVRELQSQGFGASLDVPESSKLAETSFPGA
jgi:hypothetical protein